MSIFSNKNSKPIPQTLNDCTKPESVVTTLYDWAVRLKTWGRYLFVALILIGIASTIIQIIPLIDGNEEMILPTLFSSIVIWTLSASIEYFVYHILSILITALASITYNTSVCANVALFENRDSAPPAEDYQQPFRPVAPHSATRKWVCPQCGEVLPTDIIRCKCGHSR